MSAAKPRKDVPDRLPPSEGAPADPGAPSFEERLAALEAVVKDLEGEDLPLETSLRRYREGVEHLKACRSLLDDAERRLAELVAEPGPGGEVRVKEKPLQVSEKGLVDAPGGAANSGSAGNAGNAGKKPAPNCDEIPF